LFDYFLTGLRMNENDRIFDFVDYQISTFPKEDMFAAREGGAWRKYATTEVKSIVDDFAAGLLKLGVGGNDMPVEKQDKIALVSRNRPEWMFLDFACQQTGAVLCPIYPTTSVTELEFIFNDAEVKYVFVSGQEILDKVNIIRTKVPSLLNVYCFDELEGAEYWKKIPEGISSTDKLKMEEVKNSIRTDQCATIIYTSGTTGFPKGVMLSHRNIVSNVLNAKKSFPFTDDINSRSLSFLPLNHIFERAVTLIYISSGTSIYYASSLDTIGEDLKEVKPHLFATVPRLLEKVFEKIMAKGQELTGVKRKLFDWSVSLANEYELSGKSLWYRLKLAIANKLVFSKWREGLGNNINFIITGGAACQVRLIRIFTAAGIPIYEGYGPTENSPVITVNRKEKGGRKFGTVGPVIDGQSIKLEPDGEICGPQRYDGILQEAGTECRNHHRRLVAYRRHWRYRGGKIFKDHRP
jgi:long-chain acyl-CoA synthetase